uniref:DUF3707 domain-containing protein n=1 Tax=Strongyloides papillosus TaxID=174720 RepID=A0A0N5BKH1_STREA
MMLIIVFLVFIKLLECQRVDNYCKLYQDFYYKPNTCNYQVIRTNISQIYCPETFCLYASGYIQVSRFKIFEGKFYGCPSFLRYIGGVLNIDSEIFDSSISKCQNMNSCMEVNYKLPTTPGETIIDMTLCCNNENEQKFHDPPPVVIEPCNSNCSNIRNEQIILPVVDCLPVVKNNINNLKISNIIFILSLILMFLQI